MSSTIQHGLRRGSATHVGQLISRLWLPVLGCVVWWIASEHSTSLYFPPLRTILQTFRQDWLFADLGTYFAPSVRNMVIGFVLASVGGVGIGLAVALNGWLSQSVGPVIQFLRSIPPPAILPAALLFLGTGNGLKVGVIVFGSVWPILISTIDGVRGPDPILRDLQRVYRLTRWRAVRDVILPAAAPQIFAGMRVGLQVAIVMIIVSEMLAANGGIGYYVLKAQEGFDVPQTWAGTVLLGLLGIGANACFGILERRALGWQRARADALADSHAG